MRRTKRTGNLVRVRRLRTALRPGAGAHARTHAKSSGNAAYISGYIGKSEALADALYTYAHGYAKQTERDFEQFQQACRKGRLQARSETNFAADHLP
ncbi:hypothetical protein D9M71_256320 [compost metagenome]